MSEPTLSKNCYDLIKDVAIAAGVAYYGANGDKAAMIPINEHDLEKCLRCVNDGIEMFIAMAPDRGWRWMNRAMEITFATIQTEGTADSGDSTTLVDDDLTDTYDEDDDINGYYIYDLTQEIYAQVTDYTALTGTVTVTAWLDYYDEVSSLTPAEGDEYSITDLKTVEGDKARYPLSQYFRGDYSDEVTYGKDTNKGRIFWVNEATIRQHREIAVNTGEPYEAAVRPWKNRRWEFIVNPSPTAADTVEFPYKVGFDKLQLVAGGRSGTTGGTTSLVDADLANLYPNDYFNGWYIHIIAGTGRNSYAKVTDYAGTTGTFTVADWLSINGSAGGTDPSTDTIYYVEPANNYHPAGHQFDDAVKAACLAVAEREFTDLDKGYTGEFMQRALPKAYSIDSRSLPIRTGFVKSGGGRRYTEWKRPHITFDD